MSRLRIVAFGALATTAGSSSSSSSSWTAPATPSPQQREYMESGLTMFVHFSPNTFMNATFEHNCDPADLKKNPYDDGH
jgi:hypothetical protein